MQDRTKHTRPTALTRGIPCRHVAVYYQYLVHGLVLSSALELPLPPIEHRQPDVIFRDAVGKAIPDPVHVRADSANSPSVVERWAEDSIIVEFPNCAMFEVDRESVLVLRRDTKDDDLMAHLLLDHVLPRVLSLRGDLVLHASGGVAPDGRANLFLGPTGAGKSSVVASLLGAGWSLIDDDSIRIVRCDNGFRAFRGAPDVRLLPDAAAVLAPEEVATGRISADSTKRRFLPAAEARDAPHSTRIAGLYALMRRTDAGGPTLERLGLADALAAISANTFHFSRDPTLIPRRAFEQTGALAANVPVWRLGIPAGLHELGAVSDLIVCQTTTRHREGASGSAE